MPRAYNEEVAAFAGVAVRPRRVKIMAGSSTRPSVMVTRSSTIVLPQEPGGAGPLAREQVAARA